MMKNHTNRNAARGYTLIEVLVGILIFAVGMMALAQLQTNLAQNSGDASARTVAMNLAEELIETDRTFSVLESNGSDYAYNDIVDEVTTEVRSGVSFTIDKDVTDYYYLPGSATFTEEPPTGAAISDFKKIELTVTWNPLNEDGGAAREFFVDGDTTTTGGLGSGSITINEVIASMTSGAGGKASLGSTASSTYTPPVDYNPGQNPDIVSISLGANKFKESTTPLPDVLRADELVETRFDVVTYSQSDDGATFLRREEFIAVSCECTLRVPVETGQGGLRPTIWNGEDYTEGEMVAKPYGVSASNQQSAFCDICCRDHHDGGIGEDDTETDPARALYNPFRSSADYFVDGAMSGDHKHYHRDNLGNLELADQDGDSYVEACRLVRKDGFFRVAQDLRQEGLNSFPANFLDEEAEVDVYSAYVTGAVGGFETALGNETLPYASSPPVMATPASTGVVFPASSYSTATVMSSASGVLEQQLRSRGIYIDYMSRELRCKINKLQNNSNADNCEAPENVSSALEIIPFYDVQLTWLSRWTETPSNNPIDVSNEAIADDNSHSRGLASLENGFGYSAINAAVHSGNLGLTGTDPIDMRFSAETESYNLYAKAVDPNAPPQLSGIQINGEITSAVGGVKAADVEIEASDAQCDRTLTGFKCFIEEGASDPRIRVDNYFKLNKDLYACSPELGLAVRERSRDNPAGNYAIFNLPTVVSTNVTIVIKEDGC
jgi:prepilin-type N-terminal cleavage/methylation domain-containing protein